MSVIYTDILDACANFWRMTGKNPTKLYLGQNQNLALSILSARGTYPGLTVEQRDRICGLELIQVNRPDHFGVGE